MTCITNQLVLRKIIILISKMFIKKFAILKYLKLKNTIMIIIETVNKMCSDTKPQ